MSRSPILVNQLQPFSVGSDEPEPPRPINSDELAPQSRRTFEYNFVDPGLFARIQSIESEGSYGSKIQTLVRHLLYIQDDDPRTKSISELAKEFVLELIVFKLHLSIFGVGRHPF
jgi:E3 ubiquitin-protein ligase SHPRH